MLKNMRRALLHRGYNIKTENWQGEGSPPEFLELLQVSGYCLMSPNRDASVIDLKPNLPWADDHFAERIQGYPTNPDPSHVDWLPGNEKYKMDDKQFSHTYSERMWPKGLYNGIRFEIGDLNTAVQLLKEQPNTRQLVIPMYLHEDLSAAALGERVPCSLHWNFINRGGQLHCTYTMRSTDALRHAHNDLYFANRLTLWLIEQSGVDLTPGQLSFTSTSFHCFENDRFALARSVGEKL